MWRDYQQACLHECTQPRGFLRSYSFWITFLTVEEPLCHTMTMMQNLSYWLMEDYIPTTHSSSCVYHGELVFGKILHLKIIILIVISLHMLRTCMGCLYGLFILVFLDFHTWVQYYFYPTLSSLVYALCFSESCACVSACVPLGLELQVVANCLPDVGAGY